MKIGEAIDWADTHRNIVGKWTAGEASANRMKKVHAAAHCERAGEVFRVLSALVRSVDGMAEGQGFPPIEIPLAVVRSAEQWLSKHVGRVERWAEVALHKHRSQNLLLKAYRGPDRSVDDGSDETWQKERRDFDPQADEFEEGDKVVVRTWGLSHEQAEREVRCARLALALVRSVCEASEKWVVNGTYPIPSIVRQAMP